MCPEFLKQNQKSGKKENLSQGINDVVERTTTTTAVPGTVVTVLCCIIISPNKHGVQ